MPINDRIRDKLSQLPHKPGVYLMRDRFGTVIYVGKARALRKRVSQYFHPSRRQGWDLKLAALIEAIDDFDVHVVRSEPEALLLEGRLIKEFKPRYNVSFRDDKNFLLIKVNLNDPIPRFALTRVRQQDGARYFGPFASGGACRRTITMLRKKFSLRGCRPLQPTERDYKHCLYGHLQHCSAPCVGKVSPDDYRQQVAEACDYLEGQTGEWEKELEAVMQQAAGARDYEKAARYRDMIRDLRETTRKSRKFTRMPAGLPGAIDPARDLAALGQALGLAAPPARIEGFDISNISGTFMVASMVSFSNGKPDRAQYRRFRMKSVAAQDDFACMAETVWRRYSRLQRESRPLPDLILIDGGKGQLGMACRELAKLGLERLPVIGLAKEFEEIYRPGEGIPLRLGLDSGALKLLQRVRDESHRFANTYNAELRLKKISESILDELPGVGASRKAALLKQFGSVQQLRKASLEEIQQVPGFGKKSAQALKAFLETRPAKAKLG
ncbi:MAG: excinuclease ABC subunit UvrC [Verrucomicrobiota bacterium]|nr:excinuclease ABC subunit UvrC [Verrucomicrobiota bacterium]MDP7049305.1 excinuclease ABC subunit UvrC [Verrucomicrobiota bacterium]